VADRRHARPRALAKPSNTARSTGTCGREEEAKALAEQVPASTIISHAVEVFGMISDELLGRIKAALAEAFDERLQGVVLYGSEVRGEARPDSDIDLLVLLTPPVVRGDDLWAAIRALYPLVLELERPIHARPVDARDYEAAELPLYREVKREGVTV
jgi:predicted nucleotidyltransferase